MVLSNQYGYSYLYLLVLVFVVSLSAGLSTKVVSTAIKREGERELLFRGGQIRDAIESYYNSGAPKEYPKDLDVLLSDNRFVHRIHLRRLYGDPLSRREEDSGWRLIYSPRGGVKGVASRSKAAPMKNSGFSRGVKIVGEGGMYSDWEFVYEPPPLVRHSFQSK